MRNISSDAGIDLRRWHTEEGEANSEQLARLAAHLPLAIERELTERQRQMITMYFYENMNTSQIARKLQLNPSTVSRTLRRATQRLQRVLRYTM